MWVETPANPTWDVVDLKAVADVAHASGACMCVDSTAATPVSGTYSHTRHFCRSQLTLKGLVCLVGFLEVDTSHSWRIEWRALEEESAIVPCKCRAVATFSRPCLSNHQSIHLCL